MRKALILPGLALVSILTVAATNGLPEGTEESPELRSWNVDAPHTEITVGLEANHQ